MKRQMKSRRKYSSMLMRLVLTLLLVICSSGVNAEVTKITTSVDGEDVTLNYTLTTNGTNHTAEVANSTDLITKPDSNLIIPSVISYEGINYSVTSIGKEAFHLCDNFATVTIPESVTKIGNKAFMYCKNLHTITIPESVTSIGKKAFAGCTNFAYITVAKKNPVYSSVDGVLYSSINNKKTLVCFPASHKVAGTETMTISFEIPSGVTAVGNDAFCACHDLRSVTIPEGVTDIGDSTFFYCRNLQSITIPKSVTSIGQCAFATCLSLSAVTIPEGMTNIEDFVFFACTSLASITIPESVTSIGMGAFRYCKAFTSVMIPEKVTSIGMGAFGECENLASITVAEKNPVYSSVDGVLYSTANNEKAIVCFPARHKVAGTEEATTSFVIPSDVTVIEGYAFDSNNSLLTVTIPQGVTYIGEGAFFSCKLIQSVTIPDGVTEIGINTFCMCKSLQSVTIPESVTSIGARAFMLCGLTSLTIPNGVKTISDETFVSCDDLQSVTMPNSVTTIGTGAFHSCNKLQSVTIPESVTSIGERAFYQCGLTNVTIPNGVTNISESTFGSCDSLKSVMIPNSVTNIGDFAFSECGNLQSVTIPNSVTNIGIYAFSECGNLQSVTIPNSVTSIGYCAFNECGNLQSVTIPNSVTSIGKYAFNKCTSLAAVFVENPNTTLGDGAFKDITSCARLYVPKCRENAEGWDDWTYLTKTPRSSEDNTIRNETLTFAAEEPIARYYHYPVDLPSGVTAYTGALSKDKTKLYLTQVKTAYIPAGTPVILYGKGTVTLTESAEDDYTAVAGNDLLGSITPTYFGEGGKALMLGKNNGDASEYGFYKFDDETVPANRAFLCASQLDGGDGAQGVVISMGDPTGIKPLSKTAAIGSDRVYNLDGTPEKNPKTGTVYIVNGKRIIYIN